ncbi:RCC1-like G exchanging factor-like protein isoform X1 [Canis lupus familiaris]|uniref:RCC1 like n=2 Tax=Canis lupus TaxID=9612 RepID=A0A8P0PQX4_CANLF|nr:RCC1-like G exchanging factor-like protein isoform X1 [Canis lupus familiaris]
MAVAALEAGARLGRLLSGPGSGPALRAGRGHGTAAGRSRSRREADAPVFQYVGERAARADRVFVWGFSFSGALGVPTFVLPRAGPERRAGSRPPRRIQPVPYRLELDQKISSAACGYGFTLLSSKTKDVTKVWGMGLNKDSQLGFHRSHKDKTRGYEYVLEPSPVPLPLDRPQETRVLQVSCGRAHSLILTDCEGVFSMGNNAYGQCGRNVVENEIYSESHKVNRMQDFDGQVVQVVCGQDHSLFLTDKGEVYSCGWGADGQTGECPSVPTLLRSGEGEAGRVWRYRLCCVKWRRTCFRLGLRDSWERPKPCGNCISRGDPTHSLWPDGVQPGSPRFSYLVWSQPLCCPDQQRRAVCVGQEHPRVPWHWSPRRPVFPMEGDDAWGACGCGVWCGPHGDSGQVICLKPRPARGSPEPGLRTTGAAQQRPLQGLPALGEARCSLPCPEQEDAAGPGTQAPLAEGETRRFHRRMAGCPCQAWHQ